MLETPCEDFITSTFFARDDALVNRLRRPDRPTARLRGPLPSPGRPCSHCRVVGGTYATALCPSCGIWQLPGPRCSRPTADRSAPAHAGARADPAGATALLRTVRPPGPRGGDWTERTVPPRWRLRLPAAGHVRDPSRNPSP